MVKKSAPNTAKANIKNKTKKTDDNSESDDDFGRSKDKSSRGEEERVEYVDQVVNEDDEDDKLGDEDVDEDEWGSDNEDNESEQTDEGEVSDDIVEIEVDGDDDDCAYNTGKKRGAKGMIIDRDDEDEDDKYDDDMNMTDGDLTADVYVAPEDRRTSKYLLKYEMVRLKGDRTAQLTLGAKPMIKGVEGLSSVDIAQLELEAKMIPLKIIRPLPNGKKERWSLSELILKREYIKFGFLGGTLTKEEKEIVKRSGQSRGILGKSEMFKRSSVSENTSKFSSDLMSSSSLVKSTTIGTPSEYESSTSVVSSSNKSKGKSTSVITESSSKGKSTSVMTESSASSSLGSLGSSVSSKSKKMVK